MEAGMTEIGGTMSHFKILEKLGEGGMGVVYRAEDTNLGRQVAVKVLPDIFSGDPERLARFERDARLLASLNHTNIATIYGLEQAEGQRFLTMELVEGETLAQRLQKGPLPVEESLEVCRQIAEGLEAAHERGVIHRDLKPANIKITPEGKVKILDFGLAKAFQEETAAADLSQSPTLTAAMTRAGVILGTAAYMSPEQAKGKTVDKRTDIWVFGCILYECLSGKSVFEGETVTETLAAVLTRDPSWDSLPPATPALVRNLLSRCLERNSGERLRDIGEARIELQKALDRSGEAEQKTIESETAGRSRLSFIATAGIGLVAFIIGVIAALLWLSIKAARGF
jgi:serine/threonine protein kinase